MESVNKMKNVGSLFSGIGGIELGFEREGFETKWFIENNEYCQAVLKKHWPNIPIYGDIREIDFRKLERVDILTGGFPCQDISCANPKGKGIEGERSGLWSYYAKAIREIRPKYAVIENVPALANKGLHIVLRDIAEMGYDADGVPLRASDFGALHRRERLFIIIYPNSHELDKERRIQKGKEATTDGAVAYSNQLSARKKNREGMGEAEEISRVDRSEERSIWMSNRTVGERFITNDLYARLSRYKQESLQGEQGFSWCQDVRRIEDLCGRSDIPEPLFRGGRDGIPYWMDRIKCCGNAVVPQVAQFIARRIKEMEYGTKIV